MQVHPNLPEWGEDLRKRVDQFEIELDRRHTEIVALQLMVSQLLSPVAQLRVVAAGLRESGSADKVMGHIDEVLRMAASGTAADETLRDFQRSGREGS